jgi:hypothetical protein
MRKTVCQLTDVGAQKHASGHCTCKNNFAHVYVAVFSLLAHTRAIFRIRAHEPLKTRLMSLPIY